MFHPLWRRQALAGLSKPFDLVVLGGGITGCGILFDAAQRGLRTLLVERADLASGTSSRSSKLVHGGLRYLKQLQFGVTRESCRERDLMLASNPHLVEPLPFVLPAYRGGSTPGWKLELGLGIYDRFTREPQRHERLEPERLAELAPELPQDGLDRALIYTDARIDDARLTVATAATGLAYGGLVLTRAEPEEAIRDARGKIAGLVLRDLETDGTHRVETAAVVNATGAWVDNLRARFGLEGRNVRPSRGSHLIFRSRDLPLGAALTLNSPDDGRPVFFIPHPEGVLVGTTDLFHEGSFDDPRPTGEEVDYLLRTVQVAFPGRGLTREHVVGAFAGVRPVISQGVADPTRASREEQLWVEDGLLSIAGGKLTTWRAMAEKAVDRVLELLPRERARATTPCATRGAPLAGLAPADLPSRLATVHGLDARVARAMARRLGSLAWTAGELARDAGELQPLADGVDLCAAEVRAHLRFGGVVHLSDLLLRRARLGMWDPESAAQVISGVRPLATAELGWDTARWDRELERYARAAEGWSLAGIQEEVL